MRGPPSRRISIAASTRKLDVDNRFPLRKYYRAADNLLKQADIYREEGNIIDLFVLLLRFTSLVGETIPEHHEFETHLSKLEQHTIRLKCKSVLLELEKLKPEVQKQVQILNNKNSNQINDAYRYDNREENRCEWPQVPTNPTVLGYNNQKQNELVAYSIQNKFQYNVEQPNSISMKYLPPKKETLSRHSILGPDGLRARWTPPVVPVARVEYPTNLTERTENLSLEDKWKNELSNLELPTLEGSNDSKPVAEDQTGTVSEDVISQLSLVKQPSPPPVAAPVQDLPVMADLLQLCKHENTLPSPQTAEPLSEPLSTIAEGLKQNTGPKQLHLPAKMMEEFLKFARKNTISNIETCGVLAGSLKNGTFYITALIIPKQQATSNTCQTVNEEEIFDWQDQRGLFQLGWIHTHPSQSCFMSSVDLHTHYSYQVMLPEAIAIVMAPTDSRKKYGIFRLSDPGGIKVIQQCPLRGFHPHEPPMDGSNIYESCSHVYMSEELKYQVVDLR